MSGLDVKSLEGGDGIGQFDGSLAMLIVPYQFFFGGSEGNSGERFFDAEFGGFGVVGEDYGDGGGPEFGGAGEAVYFGEGWGEVY